jgi:hypothetical protein
MCDEIDAWTYVDGYRIKLKLTGVSIYLWNSCNVSRELCQHANFTTLFFDCCVFRASCSILVCLCGAEPLNQLGCKLHPRLWWTTHGCRRSDQTLCRLSRLLTAGDTQCTVPYVTLPSSSLSKRLQRTSPNPVHYPGSWVWNADPLLNDVCRKKQKL